MTLSGKGDGGPRMKLGFQVGGNCMDVWIPAYFEP